MEHELNHLQQPVGRAVSGWTPPPRPAREPLMGRLALLEHVFRLGYRRGEWKCDALNAPSRAAAQRLGFTFEGVFRQAAIHKGRSRDTAWYAVLDRDWPGRRSGFQQWLDPANFDERGRQRKRLADCQGVSP